MKQRMEKKEGKKGGGKREELSQYDISEAAALALQETGPINSKWWIRRCSLSTLPPF